MSYDYRKLRGRIVEKYGTLKDFASDMGWSERTLSLKMNCKVFWKQPEITKAAALLEISSDRVVDYFFTQNVQKH
nr:DUF739 family protein [uncultured Acetatifactor sp.]